MSEKIEQFWRDATADDVARVMRGETVEARFRDNTDKEWMPSLLSGWIKIDESDSLQWASSKVAFWRFCQVYDPPAWFVNKPDPGEGCRLLEKFPPERLQQGDEKWSRSHGEWTISGNAIGGSKEQSKDIWYRRRIEVNNPEIPDSSNSSEIPNSCRSRDTIPSGFRVLGKDEERLASDAYWSLGAKDWILIGDDRVEYANEFKTSRWHAIRRVGSFDLVVGFNYTLPSGKRIRITAKGFEVV